MADDLLITIGANVKGVVTAIDTTKSLENRVIKLQKAIDQGRISNAQFDSALQKLAKSSKTYEKSVIDYSKALQAANKAQKDAAAAEALAKKETQAFAQARKDATAINTQFNAQRKLEVAEAQRATAEEERLKNKFIEGHAAMALYTKELNDLAVARKAGIITAAQQQTSLTSLNQQMAAGTGVFSGYGASAQAMTKKNNQLGVATQQLGYQVGDFFVQVQSGTNPMVAFGQQATQLVGVLPMVATQLGLTRAAAISLSAALGIIIPIATAIGAVLLTMYMNTESAASDSVTAVKALKEELASAEEEALKLSRGLSTLAQSKVVDEINKLESQIASLKETASQADPESYGFIMLNVEAREKELAVLKETLQASLDQGHESYRLQELERARLALQQAAAQLRIEEAQAYADTVEEANKLKDSLGQAYLEALGLAQVPLETGVDKAAEAARLLSIRLGISLTQAQNLVNLAAASIPTALPMTMAPSDPAGFAYNNLGIMNPSNFIYTPPSVNNSGDTGGGSAPSDPLADLMKRIELEKELLGTSEAYKEVLQAIQGSDKQYSDAAIQGAVARVEALNKEKALLEQMESQHKEIGDVLRSSMTEAFMSMVDGTKSVKDAFKDMARAVIAQLYEILVVKQMVNSIVGALGFADGGAFSAGKQIQAYANGGVVGGPTYFPMSGGKTGLMGEAGPEAIMPLKRGKGGKLGVSVEGGSGSVNVTNNINVTGGSDPAAIRAEVAKLMPQITSATKSAVIDARRRGGQMRAAFQ